MRLSKLIYIFIICSVFAACNHEDAKENIVSSDEGVVSITEIDIEIITLSLEEQEEIKKETGLYVLGGGLDQTKEKLPCRWSDDLDGDTYGLVECKTGSCSAGRIVSRQRGTQEQVIICTDSEGNTTTGAGRGETAWP
jgi:hypothetical protein